MLAGALILPSQIFPMLPSRQRRSTIACSEVADSPTIDRKSLYEVLRVKRNASQGEIKTAYRTLAKIYHPDAASRFMDSPIAASSTESGSGDFIEIHNAYTTLSDPDARATYDLKLGVGPERRSSAERFRAPPSRRWETDQCW